MKKLLILLICLSFVSCISEKKRQKICNTCPSKTEVKDSIVYKLKDTTIFLTVAGPTQWLENPCKLLCDSLGNLKPFVKEEKKNGIKSTIKSVGNSIVAECEADSLKAVIKGLIETMSFSTKVEVIEKKIPCKEDHRTKWDGFTYWWFWITIVLLVLFVLYKKFKSNISFLNR